MARAVIWELEINGTRRDLADWKLEAVTLRRVSMGADILQATRVGEFDATALCAYRDEVALYRDGVCWFRGQRILVPGEATGASESQTYVFANAWAWLERNVYRELWFGGAAETSHIITVGSAGYIIGAVLDYAIGKGADFTYLQADLDALTVIPPSNESTGKLCATTILDALQFAPDTVTWFDYTNDPPILRLKQRAGLTNANVRVGGDTTAAQGPIVEVLRITPRPDLQVPRVHLIFETIETIDGEQRLYFREEIAPAAATFADGELSDVVIVQGRNVTTAEATILAETIVANETAAGLQWFKQHIPSLTDPRVNVLRIVPGSITRTDYDGSASLGYPRELVEGQLEDWMINPDDTAAAWQKEVITVEFDLEFFEDETKTDAVKLEGKNAARFTFEIVSTNAPDGETLYHTIETVDEADPQPFGLAQSLYASLSALQYEARFALVEEDCTAAVSIGHKLNLQGSLAEYRTMDALVQEVTFDLDSGTTTIACGPPRVLSISDVLAIFKANRGRRRWTNPSTQSDGNLSSSGRITLGRATPNNNTVPGGKARDYVAIKSDDNKITLDANGQKVVFTFPGSTPEAAKSVTIDAADAVWSAATNKALAVREVCVKVNGVSKKMLVLGSEPYL